MKRPNIVYFVADQLRSDALGVHGNPVAITPNLDAFATQEAVTFTNAYCQNPVCVPSRNSFLSGLYPHTTGHRTMHFLANDDDPNILKVMKDQGYEVIWCGRNDVVPANKSKAAYCDEYYDGRDQINKVEPIPNQDHSFKNSHPNQVEVGPDLYSFYLGEAKDMNPFVQMDWNTLESALNYLERKAQSKDDKPFFLYVTLWFPHPPYTVEKPWYGSTDRSKLPPRRPSALKLTGKASMLTEIARKQGLDVWDEAKFDELRGTYLDMVSRYDHHFSLLLNKLKETKLYEDTSLFVFSDHGDLTTDYSIAEKAQNLFENPISNIPLMVKPAKQFKVKPGKNEALVELVDLSATVADMVGFEMPYTQFGKSMVDAIAGNPFHKDAVICEGGRIHGEKQAMELGHTEVSPYYPRLSTQYSEGPEHTKAVMIRMKNFKYTYRLYEQDEFYDLDKDPYELNNAIEDPAYAQDIKVMRDRLLQFMIETGDYVPNRRDLR
jgi:arylsulfatase A-like enzyme